MEVKIDESLIHGTVASGAEKVREEFILNFKKSKNFDRSKII
ncbi:hypothetical protein ACFL1Z_05260 [Thermodesulfobacteriota bacterium]